MKESSTTWAGDNLNLARGVLTEMPLLASALMQIPLYIHEDAMAHALVQGLRARGVDVATVIETSAPPYLIEFAGRLWRYDLLLRRCTFSAVTVWTGRAYLGIAGLHLPR